MRNLILTILMITIAITLAVTLVLFDEIFPGTYDNIFGTPDEYDNSTTYQDAGGNIIESHDNQFDQRTYTDGDEKRIGTGDK
jgi:hypothetical protein